MINQISCKLYNLIPIVYNFFYCIYFNKKDNIIFLVNPRIVYEINSGKYSLSSPSVLFRSRFLSVDHQQIKPNHHSSIKFEKKNKSNTIVDEDIINKKDKVSSKKKKRSKITMDNDDFFIKDTNLVKDVNVEDLNFSLARPVKNRKHKKKEKNNKHIFSSGISNLVDGLTDLADNSNIHGQDIQKSITFDTPLTIQQLSSQLNVSEASIITWLFLQGISVTINDIIDASIATKVAHRYGFLVTDSIDTQRVNTNNIDSNFQFSTEATTTHGVIRAPIITVFGHVDHGKTTFLDYVAQTDSVHKEVGGITQSITAYEVHYTYMSLKKKLIFLDTPGHEAFVNMRLRSAEVTDIGVIIVAADDGIKPQTIEAINYIMARKIPYIVAINKVDKNGINLNKVKAQLGKYGILDDQSNNNSMIINISALTGYNVNALLDKICHLSNSLNLKADLETDAQGVIIEAYLNKKIGPIATIVLKNGSLSLGDVIVAGDTYGRVKTMKNNAGVKTTIAYSSAILQIVGFSSVPQTGLNFCIAKNEKEAKNLVVDYLTDNSKTMQVLNSRVTWRNASNNTKLKNVNLILKADTQGSIEAIIHAFSKIPQEKVQINIISYGLGSVYENDLDLAVASHSIILAFNVQILSSIRHSAEKFKIIIRDFNVIYDLLDYVEDYMLSLVPKQHEKVLIGNAIVQTVFHMNKGTVAGCFVRSGTLKQDGYIIVYRDSKIVYEGFLTSLRHLKDNVMEVLQGNECGILCSNYNLWQQSDQIEVFDLIEKNKTL